MSRSYNTRIHRGRVTCEAEVEIDLNDVLEGIDDTDLRKECDARGITVVPDAVAPEDWRDFADEMRQSAASGDAIHFEVMIVRMLTMARVPRLRIPEKVAVKV